MHIEAARGRDELPSWSLNTDAHLRSVILGRSQTVPVVDGAMMLGDFGRFYFADFDQIARARADGPGPDRRGVIPPPALAARPLSGDSSP